MIITQTFERLPSDAGVTFQGFEDIIIESREKIRHKLQNFLKYCISAKSPAIRAIIGEWGEGKTDCYERYIYPEVQSRGDRIFFIPSSTLANSYETPASKRLIDKTPLSAAKFLIALLGGVRHEEKTPNIPDPEDFEDPELFVENSIKRLTDIGQKKVYFFIDEFEELLLNERLNEIISGIKEVINPPQRRTVGVGVGLIHEGGECEGCVHLILSCTPDAYYRLETDDDVSLIFGGLARRGETIELPEIRKVEGIKFCLALLEYSYPTGLPNPLPVESCGVMEALYRISHGNPGIMVSLFTRLMTNAKIDDKELKVVGSEEFLDFIEKETIPLFGFTTNCLEPQIYSRIIRNIKDQRTSQLSQNCKAIFRHLLGQPVPHTLDIISSKLNIQEKSAKNAISIINNDVRRSENIESIIKVQELKEELDEQNLKVSLQEFIEREGDTDTLRIGNYIEPWEEFLERISHFVLQNGQLVKKIYLPSSKQSVQSVLEGIDEDRVVELRNKFNRLTKDNENYIISDQIILQLFPTPIPKGLEFIKDKQHRIQIWRRVSRELFDRYERNMPEAFLKLVTELPEICWDEYRKRSNWAFGGLIYRETRINTLFFSVNGDTKVKHIEEISNFIRNSKPPVHLAIVLSTGELTPNAREKIQDKSLGTEEGGKNLILHIRINPTLSKRLLVTYEAIKSYPNQIEHRYFEKTIELWLDRDLEYTRKLDSWLKKELELGLLVDDLKTEFGMTDFADAVKFFVNFPDDEGGKPTDIFEYNVKHLLNKFVLFGSKLGLIPDIETLERFSNICEDLAENKFLLQIGQKYIVKDHLVEKRILEILEAETKATEEELRDHFVFRAKMKKLLSRVFLNILEYKGLIIKSGTYYSMSDPENFFREVSSKYQELTAHIDKKELQQYGHVYITKKRAYRLILLEEFSEFAKNLFQEVSDLRNEDQSYFLQKIALLDRLLTHFLDEIVLFMKRASQQGKSIYENVEKKFDIVKQAFEDICYRAETWLRIRFSLENIQEYSDIKITISKEIKSIHQKIYTESEISNLAKKISNGRQQKEFYFQKKDLDAHYFNLKLREINKNWERLSENIEKLQKHYLSPILEQFKQIEEEHSKIDSVIKTINIPDEFKLSNAVFSILKPLKIIEAHDIVEYNHIKLPQLKRITEESGGEILSKLNILSKAIERLDDLIRSEKVLLEKLQLQKEASKNLSNLLDIPRFEEPLRNFNDHLFGVETAYFQTLNQDLLSDEDLPKEVEELIQLCKIWVKRVDSARSEIETEWESYQDDTKSFIRSVEEIRDLVSEKHSDLKTIKLNKAINDLKKKIKRLKLQNLNFKCSKIEEDKKNLRKLLYDSISIYLSEIQAKLLEWVVKLSGFERARWVTLSELSKEVIIDLMIEREEFDEQLRFLIKEKYLKGGVSLFP